MNSGPLRVSGPLDLSGGKFPLGNRPFLLLWFGQAISQLGDRIHQIAVLWWSLQLRGNLGDAGWVMVATTLPAVLVSPLAGALADRYNRRLIMLLGDFGRAILVVILAVLAATGGLNLPVLIATSLLLSVLGALFNPAAMAVVPELVPRNHLLKASSLQEITLQSATLLGPPLGGLVVAALNPSAAFFANSFSFLISALAIQAMGRSRRWHLISARPDEWWKLTRHGKQRNMVEEEQASVRRSTSELTIVAEGDETSRTSFWQELWDGVAIASANRTIGMLLVAFGLCNFFLAPIVLFLPRYATLFEVGPGGLGMLEGSLALGMLVASLQLSFQPFASTPRWFYPLCLTGIGALLVALGMLPIFWWFLIGLSGIGWALGALNVTVVAYFQKTVPPDRMGRFMGLLMMVVFATQPLGFALTGLLANTAHPGPLMTACGIGIFTIGTLLALFLPEH
ncbi:MAG: MFS transporter [Cyanobacteria bacterium NC_groundwater_1444_Ag_S-0.65um_54_12]|nr:MFS transporter [Cyanobacteria bacterium NC_groundwater_1444_Ag_S-0.65um_54_12]